MSENIKKISHLETTTHAGIAHVLLRTLDGYGVDGARMFRDAGLDPDGLKSGDERVVALQMQKVWRAAVTETGDEAFGITFAKNMRPGTLHGLGFAWIASNTLRDAFMRLVRYYRLITTAGEIVLSEADDRVTVWYKTPGKKGAAAPASMDAGLALFVGLCRMTRDDDFSPVGVTMQRQQPANTAKFDDFFRCSIEYDSEENTVSFDAAELDAPLPMANPELARANDQVVIDYLQRHDSADVVNQVRASIIDWLPSGAPSQETIADSLHMSPRTLQRRLATEDVTYSQLLDSIREELARQYLTSSSRNISEVAYLLGYSEPGNFARAFKKWNGQTPAEFRAAKHP